MSTGKETSKNRTTPTSYSRIKAYAADYCQGANNDETLAVFMPIADVLDLISRAGGNATHLVGILGDDGGSPSLTISLLCADNNCNILDVHRNGSIDGEETWGTKKTVAQFGEVFP